MRGLLVVAVTEGAAERDAGEAVALALQRQGVDAAATAAIASRRTDGLHGCTAVASPPSAAGHTGSVVEPTRLVDTVRERAGEAAVVTVAGGLLAPLARRYAVRDLALELSLPRSNHGLERFCVRMRVCEHRDETGSHTPANQANWTSLC